MSNRLGQKGYGPRLSFAQLGSGRSCSARLRAVWLVNERGLLVCSQHSAKGEAAGRRQDIKEQEEALKKEDEAAAGAAQQTAAAATGGRPGEEDSGESAQSAQSAH